MRFHILVGQLRDAEGLPKKVRRSTADLTVCLTLVGCIVVAASDSAIRFHEIWSEQKRKTKRSMGLLGGSDILECLHGLEKETEGIR
jgi:hypothetical protein